MENTRTKKHLDIEPVPFNSVGDMKITTTEQLGTMFNDIFKQAFVDYVGCNMTVQLQPSNNQFLVVPSLIFKVLPNEQYNGMSAFKPLAAMSDSNIVNRVQRLSQISVTSGAKVDFTDDGKDMLEEFIIKPNGAKKIEWPNYYHCIRTDAGTYIEFYKLDLCKMIKKLFGAKDENGSELFYQVTPTCKLNTYNQYRGRDNWVLNVLRLNQENEIATANLLGMYVAPQSGINVITATSADK